MKILLISPAVDNKTRTAKGLLTPALSLFYLKGLTPPEYEVKIVEEEVEDLNLDEDCDLVGITCMTCTAPRTYELANEFKKRGKVVIAGGIHPTILPDEVLQHVDSIIIGEAENVWEKLLNDFQNGKLKETYSDPCPDLTRFIPLDYKRLRGSFLKSLPLITSRGCPYSCDFCSIKDFYGRKIRHLPIENVVRYINESKAKLINFQDDNIVGDPIYAEELFKALTPLKIKWTSQCSISIAENQKLLNLAVKSGCVGLFMGLESITEAQFSKYKKLNNMTEDIERALRKIRKSGIPFIVSVIFGFDTDVKKTFEKSLDFLIKNKVGAVSFMILTPYPNIELYQKLKNEKRLLTNNWQYYGHNTIVFEPKHMSAYDLQSEMTRIRKKFYSYSSILRRLTGNLKHPLVFLAVNLAWRRELKIQNLAGNKLDLPFLNKLL